MKRILILGGTIFARNRGVAAITRTCVDSLRKSIRNPEITLIHTFVESYYPRKTTHLENVRIVMDDEEKYVQLYIKGFIRILFAFLWRLLSYLHINAELLLRDKVLNEYKKASIVINLSYGDMFAYTRNFYNKLLFFTLAYHCVLAILFKKPLVFYPQSIGPFSGKFSNFLAKLILDHCKIVMVREEFSKNYLLKMRIKVPIILVPDTSFILEPAPDHRVVKILSKENVETEVPLIGIALRDILYTHLNVISEVIDNLILKMKGSVIFIPHDSKAGMLSNFNDPRFLAEKMLNKINTKRRISSIMGEYTVEELRGIIGKCDLFIGAYMHANISALSMCVPTIAISYSHKTDGIMNLVGLEDYVLHINELEPTLMIQKIEKAYHNLDKNKEVLKRKIPTLQKAVMGTGELVKNIMKEQVIP